MLQIKLQRKSKHILCSRTFFSKNRAVFEIMWENIVDPNRSWMAIRHMHIAYWIPKVQDTNSEYVMFIPFPLQQLVREYACVTIIRTSRVLLTIGTATVRSVAFSKAPLAQLQAHLVMFLATGAKRCGVYFGATDRKCITLPVILAIVSPLFTV
jgi:hypothetical protein